MTTKREPRAGHCPSCEQRHKACAEGMTCPSWRTSWDVAATFGELPYTPPPSRNVAAGADGE